jgi:RNA recognition motif-containing protein
MQTEKGFAFVRYSTHDEATKAICGSTGKILNGRIIKVIKK